MKWRTGSRRRCRAPLRVWRSAWIKDVPSNTKAIASTAYAQPSVVSPSSGAPREVMPCQTETAALTLNNPNAANIDQL